MAPSLSLGVFNKLANIEKVLPEILAVSLTLAFVSFRSLAREGLGIYDELAYLSRGLGLLAGSEIDFDNSPVYSIFYLGLAWLSTGGDPAGSQIEDLYLLGRAATAVAVSFGVWVSLRILAGPGLSALGLILVALSDFTYVWPGVYSLPTVIFSISIALLIRWPGQVWIQLLVAILTWVASGVRPEFLPAAVVVSLAAAYSHLLAKGRRNLTSVSSLIVLLLAIPVALFSFFGVPGGSGRSFVALWQHFALRNVPQGVNPWIDGFEYFRQSFPSAESLTEMIRENPGALSAHIWANFFETFPRLFWGGFFPTSKSPTQFALNPDFLPGLIGFLGTALVLSAAIGVLRRFMRSGIKRVIDESKHRWFAVLFLAVVSGSIILAASVIFPRDHYLQPLFALTLVLSIVAVAKLKPYRAWPVFSKGLVSLAIVAILLEVPWVYHGLKEPPGGVALVKQVRHADPLFPLVESEVVKQFLPVVGARASSTGEIWSNSPEGDRLLLVAEKVDLVELQAFEFGGLGEVEKRKFLAENGFEPMSSDTDFWLRK